MKVVINSIIFNTRWKNLISNTFEKASGEDVYKNKLKRTWKALGVPDNTYDYRVYTNLVKTLDPITQLIIYYKHGE